MNNLVEDSNRIINDLQLNVQTTNYCTFLCREQDKLKSKIYKINS